MKKLMLCLAAAIAGLCATAQTDNPSVKFSYFNHETIMGATTGAQKDSTVYLAIGLPPEVTSLYAGNEITEVMLTSGMYKNGANSENHIKDVTIFMSNGLQEEPFYTQQAQLSEFALSGKTIELTTPQPIEKDKTIIIGYYFKTTAAPAAKVEYYLPVDGQPTDNEAALYYGHKKTNSNQVQWGSGATQVGALRMNCTIKGAALPRDGVTLSALSAPDYLEPGKPSTFALTVKGDTYNDAESIDVSYTIGESEAKTVNVKLDTPLKYATSQTVNIDDVICDNSGISLPVEFKIVKVNGNNNTALNATESIAVHCYEGSAGFDWRHLIEECTGTWCPWCPRGIVMMDYVKANYPDKFVTVALHVDDEMSVSAITSVHNVLKPEGYPWMFINRIVADDPGYLDYIDEFAAMTAPTYVGITDLKASVDEKGAVSINSKVSFALDVDNQADEFRLGYYLVQDNMGPYKQANNYAGGINGVFHGWETKGSKVSIMHDHVARAAVGAMRGVSKSIPSEIVKSEVYEHTASSNLKNINAASFKVIAFVFNTRLGIVLNAAEIEVENPYFSSIDEVSAPEAVSTEWFDLKGHRVTAPSAPGLYIERTTATDGSVTSAKRFVK